MPIPVVIPSGAQPITDDATSVAERWLEMFTRIVQNGTTGASLNTPACTVDSKNTGTVVPVSIDTPEKQLFFRQSMVSFASAFPSFIFAGTCLSGDAIGDLMYVNASSKVLRKADITDQLKMPSIGFIIAKPSSTSCIIQVGGSVSGLYTGLTPGAVYFVGSNSRPTTPIPTPPPLSTYYTQQIGLAIDTNLFLFNTTLQIITV